MVDRKTAVQKIENSFSSAGYPAAYLMAFDHLECLASHYGRETFLVKEKATQRLCIAKCYDSALFKDLDSIDMLSGMHHEGLPSFCGSYRNEAMFIFARSYIEGVPLSDYARDRELTQSEVIGICVKLADILIYLHGRIPPVIHRDIKPENIIVTEDGNIVLIDFDIARIFKSEKEADTVFFGTRGYAPPEQYGFAQTDPRSDMYAFGILLRFLLTDSVRENSKIRIYRPLKKSIDRCTAFAPENRYADMQQVKRAAAGKSAITGAADHRDFTLCTCSLGSSVSGGGKNLPVYHIQSVYRWVCHSPCNAG